MYSPLRKFYAWVGFISLTLFALYALFYFTYPMGHITYDREAYLYGKFLDGGCNWEHCPLLVKGNTPKPNQYNTWCEVFEC